METVELSAAQKKSRRGRNIALGVLLAGLVVRHWIVRGIERAAWWCCSTSSPSSRSARTDGLTGGEGRAWRIWKHRRQGLLSNG